MFGWPPNDEEKALSAALTRHQLQQARFHALKQALRNAVECVIWGGLAFFFLQDALLARCGWAFFLPIAVLYLLRSLWHFRAFWALSRALSRARSR